MTELELKELSTILRELKRSKAEKTPEGIEKAREQLRGFIRARRDCWNEVKGEIFQVADGIREESERKRTENPRSTPLPR